MFKRAVLGKTLPALFVIYFGAFGLLPSGLSTRGLQIVSLVVLAAGGALLWRRARWTAAMPVLIAAVGVQVVALLAGDVPRRGVPQVVLWIAVVMVYWLSTAVDVDTLRESLFAILAAAALIAIYQAVGFWVRVDMLHMPPRLGSVLWNPNSLAFVVVIGIALAAGHRRWFWLIVFLGALALTGSVTSIVVLALGAVVYFVLSGQRLRIGRRTLIAGVAVAAALIPVVVVQIARRSQRGVAHGSLGQRIHLWRVAITTFLRQPLTGAGPESFKEIFLVVGRLKPGPSYHHAHSVLFHTLAETGLLGLAVLGWMIAAAVLAARRAFLAGRRQQAALAAGLLTALLAHGLVDYVYWIPAVILIVLWAGRVILESEPRPLPSMLRRHASLRDQVSVVEVLLVGLAAFRVTAHLDDSYAALARYTTALGLFLAVLLFLVYTRQAAPRGAEPEHPT